MMIEGETHKVVDEDDGDGRVDKCAYGEPDDNGDLELLKIEPHGDDADRDGGRDASDCRIYIKNGRV
jgi:hypothetical protein